MYELTPEQEKMLASLLGIMRTEIREKIYTKVPYAEPRVVEAILLLYDNFLLDCRKEIESSNEETVTQLQLELILQNKRLTKAIKDTVEQLYGVKVW